MSRAWPSVSTGYTVRPSGTRPASSSQFAVGARNVVAPASAAPRTFCGIPPMGPTTPSPEIVPVPAIGAPPVIAPGVSRSITVSANIRPAEGPPMSGTVSSTSTGTS